RLLRDDLRRHPGAAMAVAATFALAAASLGACRRLAVVAAAGPALALLPALGAIAAAGALVAALALRRARRSAEIGLMLALGFTRGAAFLPAIASVVGAARWGCARSTPGGARSAPGWRRRGRRPPSTRCGWRRCWRRRRWQAISPS